MAAKAGYSGKHQAPPPTTPPHPRSRNVKNRRPGPAHATGTTTPTTPTTPKPRKRAPAKKAASPAAPAAPNGGASARKAHRQQVLTQEARDYAWRQAYRATTAKPSVTGRAASGAAAGAASGAALGSVVPGIGTALGAGAGAVVGGTGGAVAGAKAKKAYKASLRSNGNARRVLVAEFAVCVVIAALSPLTDKRQSEAPGAWMKRMTAILGIFFILGLVSAAGRGASKIAAGFGGIVAVTLALSERDLFMKVATIFASTTDKPDTGTGPTGEGAIGEAPESDQGGPVAPRRVGSAPLPPREVSLPPRGA